MFSIVVAEAIFGSIPVAIANMVEGEKVMERPVIVFNLKIGPFWFYVPTLFGLFFVGILLFSVSLLALVLCS